MPSIYLADPDEVFRDRLAQALRTGGAQVHLFASGSELARCARERAPDLVLFAGEPASGDTQVFARLRGGGTSRGGALVLVADRERPPEQIASSVLEFLEDWTRLYVRNLAGVLTWLQAQERSGRLELKAFGERGSIVLRAGEVVEARWKELRGRKVVEFLIEALPEIGFRFAQSVEDRAVAVPVRSLPLPDRSRVRADGFGNGGGPRGQERPLFPPTARARLPLFGPPPEWSAALAGLRDRAESPRPLLAEPQRRWLRDLHLELARELINRRRFGDALSHLGVAGVLGGPTGELGWLRGLAHLGVGELEAAVQELRAATGALPGEPLRQIALQEALDRLDARQRAFSRAAPPLISRAVARARTVRLPVAAPSASAAAAIPGAAMPPVSMPPAATAPAVGRAPAPRPSAPAAATQTPAGGSTVPPAAPGARSPDSGLAIDALPGQHRTGSPSPAERISVAAALPAAPAPATEGQGPSRKEHVDATRSERRARVRGRPLWRMAAAAAAGAGAALGLLALPALLRDEASAPVAAMHRRVAELGEDAQGAAVERGRSRTLPGGTTHAPTQNEKPPMARVPLGPLERDPRSDKEDGAERGAGVPTSVAGAADDRRDASVRNEATARPTSAAPTAAPPLSLEALRGQPRATPVDAPPVPRTLRDRGVRQLVDPASGTIEVISAWGDTLSREREAELWVLVDAAGKVHEVYLSRSSGLPSLDDVAVGAVTNVIYAPARRGAGPVPAWVRQRVAFKLE